MTCKQINACRVCGNKNLVEVLDLGTQVLTGVFPATREQEITAGPLKLVKCHGEGDICHLLQLQHSYDLEEMYGDNYGYRSGLNNSMVRHLESKVSKILEKIDLHSGDLVIDIGSNDGTTLGIYPDGDWDLVGIDPTGEKFGQYYRDHVQLIPDFFSAARIKQEFGSREARIITSFSMFYDLEDPVQFTREIADLLAADGIWFLEQSYMPEMMRQSSYDTVCHEHLEYYGLAQINWIVEKVGMKILDVEFNDINGGSFSVSVARKDSRHLPDQKSIDDTLRAEEQLKTIEPYRAFSDRVKESKDKLLAKLHQIRQANKQVYGLGASTKGNVILQFCRITTELLPKIGEVNAEKYGKFTPGSLIPIHSEDEILNLKPDYVLVLPWHFREFFQGSEKFRQTELLYPL